MIPRPLRVLCVCLFTQAIALSAFAQAGPPAAQSSGSLGFKLSDDNRARLHPFVDVDTHWVTNPGRLSVPGPSDLESSARLGFDLAYPSDVLELNGDGAISYNQYWGVLNTGTRNFSNLAGRLASEAIFNKEGNLQLRLNETFVRSADPGNQTFTERLLHYTGQLGIAMDIKPGGGALMFTLGVGGFYDYYDRNQAQVLNGSLDNGRVTPEARLSWKFLPKTAIFVEGTSQITWFNTVPYGQQGVRNINSGNLMTFAGLAGNITRKIVLMAKAGYGNTFMFSGPDNLQTFVGKVELTYNVGDTSRIQVGASRSIQPASYFRWFTMNNLFFRWDQQFSATTLLSISPQFNLFDFGPTITNTPGPLRRDYQVYVDFTLSQKLAEWLTLSLVDRFDFRISNYVSGLGNVGYTYNDVLLRIDVRY